MPDIETVPALLPLSLLEAIRNLDTPVEDGLEELSPEIVAKRLGLSATVAAQIERYRRATDKDQPVPRDEAVSVFRLVGRRVDHPLVFADAGRRAARYAVRAGGGPTRTLLKMSPEAIGRRVGRRGAARVARDSFGAELKFSELPEVRLVAPLSVAALPGGEGCAFYAASFAELLRSLTGFEGAMVHERCRARGDTACTWRGTVGEGYD